MGAGEPKTILVVEDDCDVRDALIELLEYRGYLVVGAANGREALDRLRSSTRPALILLDLMMPVMDGWQFRAEQLRDPSLAPIPVVVISADGNVPQKAAAIGVASYLQKPVEADALLSAIERYDPTG
jgi:CheY-like chemotaxis protein